MLAKKKKREGEEDGSSPDGVYGVYLLIGHLKGNGSTLSTQTHTHISQKKKRFRQFQQAAHSAGTLCLSVVVYVLLVSSLISLSPSTPSIPEQTLIAHGSFRLQIRLQTPPPPPPLRETLAAAQYPR